MSHKQNKLDQYLDTLALTILCPYCGEPNQLDPPSACCGEVHAEEMYDDGDTLFSKSELRHYFEAWLSRQPEAESPREYPHEDPMTKAKDYADENED